MTTGNANSEKSMEKLYFLESLRGIAALSVAIYHFDIGSLLNNLFTKNSWILVDFFFVLSGFVISLNYQNRITEFRGYLSFIIKRLLRLYPLHIGMLLVYLAIEVAKYIAETQYGLIANDKAFSRNNAFSFVTNLFLVQNLAGPSLSWNYPSWSISAEFCTYILFGALALLLAKKKSHLVFASAILASSALYVLIHTGMDETVGVFRCTYAFFIGVLCFNYSQYVHYNLAKIFSYVILAICISGILMIDGKDGMLQVAMPIFFAAFIFSLVKSKANNTLIKILNNDWLVYLGTISYGVYMIHTSIWWFLTQALRFIIKVPTTLDPQGRTIILIENPIFSNGIILAGLGLIIYLAHISYRHVEMPANNLRHRITSISGGSSPRNVTAN